MELGMIGLGRMGSNMVQRLLAGNHRVVVYREVVPEYQFQHGDAMSN